MIRYCLGTNHGMDSNSGVKSDQIFCLTKVTGHLT